ncbi:cation:proton antiporter [Streptomyces sp. NPDC090108]|uniref:cation:proton antiporter n=1 Tax=Streptomyces sp. NPDC090108 TaxID=3365947 RepID=UPI00381DAC00
MRRYLGVYALIVVLPVLAAAAVLATLTRHAGPATHTTGPAAGAGAGAGVGGVQPYQLLVAAAVVAGAAALGGAVARRCGQPAVVGELLAGLALGPSLLGACAPRAQQWLFPAPVLPHLDTLAQLGVVFFMFLVGAEVPSGTLRTRGPAGLVIGHASIAVPFLAGLLMAWWLHGRYPPAHTGRTAYLLFVALSFSITAFPVLARVLSERRLLHTPVGVTGLTAAGVGDATAWGLLAVVIALVRGTSLTAACLAVVFVTAFALVMWTAVAPLVARAVARAEQGRLSADAVCAALVCLILLSALATDRMGVHAIFGAFMAGVVMPRTSPLIGELRSRIQGVTVWLLLPLFFVSVGLNTQLRALDGAAAWAACALITVVAVTAKMAGAGAAALATGGHTRREALALGAMMNCRGLTELVVLSLGVQLGVLDDRLFAMFVCMALVTTAMTGPLLHRLLPVPQGPPPEDRRDRLPDAKEMDRHAPQR